MTEQFSQEYIAFIRKAEAVQALWNLDSYREGDHVWVDGKVGVVAAYDSRDFFSDESVRLFAVFHARLNMPLGDPKPGIWARCNLIWLPTLFQLIRVIEGAGWRWQRDMDEKWLIVKGAEYYRAEGWKDGDMLAAAQLAVRAVEEK